MKRAGSLSNNDLMAACRESGKGGGWEPEAIEHWRWQMLNGEGKERVLAWVKLHSIARGSPKCIDEAGRPLRVESCAADLGLALQTVLDRCTILVAEGRIRLKKSQLWYRADVPENLPAELEAANSENSCVHKNFPAYVIDFYEKQSIEKRVEMDVVLGALVAWRQQAFLEGLAGLRHEISRVEINTLRGLGAPKFVLPKTAAQSPRWFQPMLLDEPDFVQKNSSPPVSEAVNRAVSAGVQTGASLLSFRPDQTVERSPPPPSAETSVSEVVMVASRIEGLNVKTATQLLHRCRAVEPSLTALEVVYLAGAKLAASRGAHTPVGLLLRTLADEAAGPPLARAREAARREEEATDAQRGDARHAQANRAQTEMLCQETLDDPQASNEEKKIAREFLEAGAARMAIGKGAGDAA